MRPQLDAFNWPLYVFPTFLPCGKQYYVVKVYDESNQETKWYPGCTVTKHREGDIPEVRKYKRRIVPKRDFWKETSIFGDWKEDNLGILEACMNQDFKNWRVRSFIKDREELEELKQVVQ